ncbi:hypothetical protein K450DRAFT_297133 [Umbelopsis ramanniana AG]|uniref:Yeast cell wall synthesis Kre9/Knh1-like N-terminal domain-containing protein n=1 Tax=Umbelopsis ramanniana AG TaxID=1314678 RepID=A0AAD5EHW9_UMBRA|nr:uncharacterized protein K450DRAFT_297133 [Umbelopsis ramanniana AG]KAI8583340.1 hypothetical protein K450DRAFT_297133 [Umbelopsis ramanniana AG]
MRIATVLSLFATAALVAAQNAIGATATEPIFITSPVAATDNLHAGKHLVIEWNSHPSAPEMVDIELLQNFVVKENIGKVKSDSHRFNWAIPDNLNSSKNYAIRIGNSTYTSYSHPFSIKGEGAFPENEPTAPPNSVIATAVINTAASTASGSVLEMASSAKPMSSISSTASASSTSAAATATASQSGGSSSKLAGASLVGAAAAGAAVVAFIL